MPISFRGFCCLVFGLITAAGCHHFQLLYHFAVDRCSLFTIIVNEKRYFIINFLCHDTIKFILIKRINHCTKLIPIFWLVYYIKLYNRFFFVCGAHKQWFGKRNGLRCKISSEKYLHDASENGWVSLLFRQNPKQKYPK